jgi:hypothetical protein
MKATRARSAAAWNVGRPAPIRLPVVAVVRGRPSSSRNCKVPSTDAGRVGGLARSSGEAPVTGSGAEGPDHHDLFLGSTTWVGGAAVSTSLTERKSFYERVKANMGAPGVDGETLEAFGADLRGNLHKVWNRMSSGSYFPPPVRAVPIPKPGGGIRVLGVPTVAA